MKKIINYVRKMSASQWFAVMWFASTIMLLCVGEWIMAVFSLVVALMWVVVYINEREVDYWHGVADHWKEQADWWQNHVEKWKSLCDRMRDENTLLNKERTETRSRAVDVYRRNYNRQTRKALREIFGRKLFENV